MKNTRRIPTTATMVIPQVGRETCANRLIVGLTDVSGVGVMMVRSGCQVVLVASERGFCGVWIVESRDLEIELHIILRTYDPRDLHHRARIDGVRSFAAGRGCISRSRLHVGDFTHATGRHAGDDVSLNPNQ